MDAPVSPEANITLGEFSRVLNDVNKIRLAFGIAGGKLPDLPKGKMGNPEQCVLARALSNGWKAEVDSQIVMRHPDPFDDPFDWKKATDKLIQLGFDVYFYDESYEYGDGVYGDCDSFISIELSSEMRQLIADFDAGLIPDLILND